MKSLFLRLPYIMLLMSGYDDIWDGLCFSSISPDYNRPTNGAGVLPGRLFSRREMCIHLPSLEEGNTRLCEATNVI